MDKNYVIVALVSALATFLLMAILGAVLLEDEPERSYEPTSNVTAEEQFVSSCRGEDPPTGFCTCAWNKLSDVYTVSEMAEMGRTEEFPTEFYDIKNQCLAEINAQQI